MGRIMVVDDEPDLLRLLKRILGRRGYEVITSSSGRECLRKAKTEKLDLILLDIMMPDMDGWEVCKALKTDPKTKKIPVVVITVMTGGESVQRGLRLTGCDGSVEKPINREKLFGTIEGFLGPSKI